MSKALTLCLTALLPAIALAGGEPAAPTVKPVVAPEHPFTLGSPLPAFSGQDLRDPQRGIVSLDRFKGQPVLVNLWASWCGPCVAELPGLAKLHARLGPKGLKIVGVSIDEQYDEAEMVVGDLDLKYTVLYDHRRVSTDLWRAETVPVSFLYDRSGHLIWRHSGLIRFDDPALEAALEKAMAGQ